MAWTLCLIQFMVCPSFPSDQRLSNRNDVKQVVCISMRTHVAQSDKNVCFCAARHLKQLTVWHNWPSDTTDCFTQLTPSDTTDCLTQLTPSHTTDCLTQLTPSDTTDCLTQLTPSDTTDCLTQLTPSDTTDCLTQLTPSDTTDCLTQLTPSDTTDKTDRLDKLIVWNN